MLMTEDEAKKLRCPLKFSTEHLRGGSSGCLASACMAWRWGTKLNPDYRPSMMQTWPPSSDAPQYIHDGEHGRCGLAGVVLP